MTISLFLLVAEYGRRWSALEILPAKCTYLLGNSIEVILSARLVCCHRSGYSHLSYKAEQQCPLYEMPPNVHRNANKGAIGMDQVY